MSGIRVSGGVLLVLLAATVAAIGAVTGGGMLVALGGGVAIGAGLIRLSSRRGPFTSNDLHPRHDPGAEWPPADVINMSRIRVAGFGGLGLVAMAAVVAIGVPSIGRAMAVAVVGGVLIALAVITLRRRQGPLPTHGPTLGKGTH